MKTKEPTCPCGSGQPYTRCCEPYLTGESVAPTAEALMRSRYTAYAVQDTKYLLESWHASTRPPTLTLDPDVQWIRLRVVTSSQDNVEFVATCKVNGKAHKMRECSRFVRDGGRWFYLDGEQG